MNADLTCNQEGPLRRVDKTQIDTGLVAVADAGDGPELFSRQAFGAGSHPDYGADQDTAPDLHLHAELDAYAAAHAYRDRHPSPIDYYASSGTYGNARSSGGAAHRHATPATTYQYSSAATSHGYAATTPANGYTRTDVSVYDYALHSQHRVGPGDAGHGFRD
jgi:hypothetical protein